MNEEITQKLRYQYIKGQQSKLEADPYYLALKEKLMTILTYTVPVVTITHGFASQEVPETFDWIKKEIDKYVKYMYPILSYTAEKNWHPHQEYTEPKERFLQPWHTANITVPNNLSLDAIDYRLSLFSQYLRERIDKYYLSPYMMNYIYKTTGLMFIHEDNVLTFDEWLYLENYDQLVTIHWNK